MFRLTVALLLLSTCGLSKDPYPRNPNIDIKHYHFLLELNDSTDVISGQAIVTVLFKKSMPSFELDLTNSKVNGRGMKVSSVKASGAPVVYRHRNNRITIDVGSGVRAGSELSYTINYSGIPEDGLIIGKNKFNERTFFGDNWPDRGRHWLPSIDHPSDKARVDFVVIAPEQYQVVATGKQVEESNLDRKRKLTHWREEVDVPVKVMTIGVARFAVQLSGEPGNVPVTTWVYPQNKEEGFRDFARAPHVLAFFQKYIGKYPYSKLAHVQSKTRFGGLENAGNIFYFENSVTGKNEREGLIAHETAHQWFGNSASENDWHHVWLSEGFATYFTALYFENTYGRDRLTHEMKQDREEVIGFYEKNQAPIVDTTITDINKVLSTNTYQKASWVLHMLRHEIGDSAFHKSIGEYYKKYQNGNALTVDFQHIVERNASDDLDWFFDQWLFKGGHPSISGTWKYDKRAKEVILQVDQVQNGSIFNVNLEIGLKTAIGMTFSTIPLQSKKQEIRIPCAIKPMEIVLDPNTWLLFNGEIRPK